MIDFESHIIGQMIKIELEALLVIILSGLVDRVNDLDYAMLLGFIQLWHPSLYERYLVLCQLLTYKRLHNFTTT